MPQYVAPIALRPTEAPGSAYALAGGWQRFTHVRAMDRAGTAAILNASDLDAAVLDRLTAPRASLAGLTWDRPQVMGILNVTPDSFSDGGQFLDPDQALAQAQTMIQSGVDILDIGGESTRPGADFVPADQEIARTQPVIAALAPHLTAPISIDTRKAPVGQAALAAGAQILNDVSAGTFDAQMLQLAKASGAPLILMHAQGDPATMQANPCYENVLFDVYDFLAARIDAAVAAGLPRQQIIVDPGIGFGKTLDHNLDLLRNLSLFHGLGCPILLGASRKRFIGTLGSAPQAQDRAPGSIAVALAAVAQGIQLLRVHDVADTVQALALWQAVQ